MKYDLFKSDLDISEQLSCGLVRNDDICQFQAGDHRSGRGTLQEQDCERDVKGENNVAKDFIEI